MPQENTQYADHNISPLVCAEAEQPVSASSGQVFEMDDDLIFDSALATMQVSVSVS